MQLLNDLSLNAFSQKLLENYIQAPQHAILIYGDKGVGLTSVATVTANIINPNPDGKYIVRPIDKKDISIEQIRALYPVTRSRRAAALTVIIEDAHTMGIAAQNALLKLLEEPPYNIYFILTAHSKQSLLPTILSRISNIEIGHISKAASTKFIKLKGIDEPKKIAQLLFLASGRPAELHRLIENDDYFNTQAEIIRQARTVLEGDKYERLRIFTKYVNNRDEALNLLITLSVLVMHNAKKGILNYQHLITLEQALASLQTNGNVRLQLLKVAVSL